MVPRQQDPEQRLLAHVHRVPPLLDGGPFVVPAADHALRDQLVDFLGREGDGLRLMSELYSGDLWALDSKSGSVDTGVDLEDILICVTRR